jgi:hypothetical protein
MDAAKKLTVTPQSVIRKHITDKCDLLRNHPDTVVGHLNHERSVTNDYRGRVLYELLQNAVDRAEKHIWIDFNREKRVLIVANDGQPFAYQARTGEPRSDFAAICAIDTSNKPVGKSIGNKGVGFKSVWSLGHSVQIRTRYEAGSWGFRLRWPFNAEHLSQWHDQTQATDIAQCLSEALLEKRHKDAAPSFYFPEYLVNPVWQYETAVTAIEIENIDDDACDDIEKLIDDLVSRPLIFVSSIRDDINLSLLVKSTHFSDQMIVPLFIDKKSWLTIDVDVSDHQDEISKELKRLGFDLGRDPRLQLALPKNVSFDNSYKGYVHSYLPTNQQTQCPIELHGDFYLEESRKSVDFIDIEYNSILLKLAVQALVDAMLDHPDEFCCLAYILEIFDESILFSENLGAVFKNDASKLVKLLACISEHTLIKTDVWFDKIYGVIDRFMPVRLSGGWNDSFERYEVAPYFKQFADSGIALIPVEFSDVENEGDPRTVLQAKPWPYLSENDKEKMEFEGRVFIKSSGDSIDITVPGIVVTDWELPIPHSSLIKYLKMFSLFQQFETISVLREIRKLQRKSKDARTKGELLKIAAQIYSPQKKHAFTVWNFTDHDAAYPSQFLQLPVFGGGWEEARYVVDTQASDIPLALLDEGFYGLDHERCQLILGHDYFNTLLNWGCWSGLPLIKKKNELTGNRMHWQLAYNQDELSSLDHTLILNSWKIWEQGFDKFQKLNPLIHELKELPFIQMLSGEQRAPNDTFLEESNINLPGYYFVKPNTHLEFYDRLGILPIEKTDDLAKLSRLAERLFPSTAQQSQIRNPALKVYRAVVKRLSSILSDEDSEVIAELSQFPVLFENKSGERGVLQEGETAWYIPSHYRSMRQRFISDEHKVWFITGDVATLASKLERVQTLAIKSKKIQAEGVFDSEFLALLEADYLSVFLAYINYSDNEGIISVDEALLEKRWGSLQVLRTDTAILEETTLDSEGNEKVILSNISKHGVLWQPSYTDPSRRLTLYVWTKFDAELHREALCRWFAHEVFRIRDLTRGFNSLLSDPKSYYVNPAMVTDAKALIDSWLGEALLKTLVAYLQAETGLAIDMRNWRDLTLYGENNLNFQRLLNNAPDELRSIIVFLNPQQRNLDAMQSYLLSIEISIAALPEPHNLSVQDWLRSFIEDESRGIFSLDVAAWFLAKVGMTQADFKQYEGRVDYELQQAQLEEGVIRLDNSGIVKLSEEPLGNDNDLRGVKGPDTQGSTPNVIPVQTDAARAKKQLSQSRSGKSAETQLACLRAQKIHALPQKDKEQFLRFINQEYQRLNLYTNQSVIGLLDKDAVDLNETNWKTLIHLGALVDGPGYDLLDYDADLEKLLLIEVKSSKEAQPVIHLSENERKQALYLNSTECLNDHNHIRWRLYLVPGNGLVQDISDNTLEVLRTHNSSLEKSEHIQAESWLLSGLLNT